MARFVRLGVALGLVAMACGQSPSSSSGSNASGTTLSPTVADPLVGRWHQEFSCEQLVEMLRREGRPGEFRHVITGLVGEMEGAMEFPPLRDPCAGAPVSFERIAQFAGGNLVFFDAPHLQDNGLHAAYEVVGDHTFVVNDTMDNVSPSPLTVDFTITGDTLTMRPRSKEIYTLSGFQAAPWIRMR